MHFAVDIVLDQLQKWQLIYLIRSAMIVELIGSAMIVELIGSAMIVELIGSAMIVELIQTVVIWCFKGAHIVTASTHHFYFHLQAHVKMTIAVLENKGVTVYSFHIQ